MWFMISIVFHAFLTLSEDSIGGILSCCECGLSGQSMGLKRKFELRKYMKIQIVSYSEVISDSADVRAARTDFVGARTGERCH